LRHSHYIPTLLTIVPPTLLATKLLLPCFYSVDVWNVGGPTVMREIMKHCLLDAIQAMPQIICNAT